MRRLRCLLLILGTLLLCIPWIGSLWNGYRSQRLAEGYDQSISVISQEEREQELQRAYAYNRDHKGNQVRDIFGPDPDPSMSAEASRDAEESRMQYSKMLDPCGDGAMGYLSIPSIRLRLMIVHTGDRSAYDQACVHVEGTSLPVGGKGSHAVLAAHRGMAGAALFTDLDQLKKGDCFYIHVMGMEVVYEVDQIKVVDPEDTGDIRRIEGEDLVTLLTCTPYGSNTQRLLVRGRRVEGRSMEKTKQKGQHINRAFCLALLALGIALVCGPGLSSRIAFRKNLAEEQEYLCSNEESNNCSAGCNTTPQEGDLLAYLRIPKISVCLPVYEGTGDEILEKGCGHVIETDLPGAEKGSHAALAGHRSLIGQDMLLHLDQLQTGDFFTLEKGRERLVFSVSQIRTVPAEEKVNFESDPDLALVTLITCTPYGANTHRLLVTGKWIRTESKEENE